jgi:outer membrane protein assembly factor BamB
VILMTETFNSEREFNPMSNRSTLLCMALLIVASSSNARAENWPRFRGPGGQGISSETNLPLTWSSSQGIAWRTPIPGNGWSSPIVWEHRVFVTTATNDGVDCHVLCLDRRTGRVEWDRLVLRQEPPHKERKNSHATPTPVTDGHRVYSVFADGSVVAVAMDGQVVWTNRDVRHYSRHGLGASPIVHEQLLIMCYDGSKRVGEPGKWPNNSAEEKIGWQTPWDQALIVALDVATGQRVWTGSRGLSRIAHTTPIVFTDPETKRTILVSTAGDVIQGFDPATGERRWTVHSQGEGVTPSPVAGDGLIFTSSGFEKTTLRTVRAGGEGDVTSTHVAWEERSGAPTQPSLLYVSPHLYAITDNGIARCFHGSTGAVIWTSRVGGNFCASPVYGDGKIYLLDEEGTTTVIRAGGEFEILAKNQLGERCQASPAISQGNLFVRGESHLYCVGAQPR